MAEASPLRSKLRLSEVQRAAQTLRIDADAPARRAIAEALGLVELLRFEAEVRLKPWLDGAELQAHWSAEAVQTCGVSLDPFATPLEGEFTLKLVPADSPLARPEAEVSIDPEAEDPPDVLDGEEIDVGAYLVEHLALEIDPFPRKPGVEFEPPAAENPPSPFAMLKALKPREDP